MKLLFWMSCARSSDGTWCLGIQGSTVQVILFGLPDPSRRRQRHRIMRSKTRIIRNTSVITSDVSSYWCALQNLKDYQSFVSPAPLAFCHQDTWLLPARTACSEARHNPPLAESCKTSFIGLHVRRGKEQRVQFMNIGIVKLCMQHHFCIFAVNVFMRTYSVSRGPW